MNSLSHSGISFLLVFLSVRGAGYQFGAQIVEKFLHVNKMRHILRAHQLCNEGYQVHQTTVSFLTIDLVQQSIVNSVVCAKLLLSVWK